MSSPVTMLPYCGLRKIPLGITIFIALLTAIFMGTKALMGCGLMVIAVIPIPLNTET
jgi:hypothetical protein